MISRREFMTKVAVVGGVFVLGFTLPGCETEPKAQAKQDLENVDFNAFIRIDSNSFVTLTVAASEMGQGAHTGLSQILAEELGADWSKVSVVMAQREDRYRRPGRGAMITGGSNSIEGWWAPLRAAGASVRAVFLEAASKEWGVEVSECELLNGIVSSSGQKKPMGELIEAASKLQVPSNPSLRALSEFTIIGQPKKRVELASKCNGTAVYGIDVELPGMVYAAVTNGPVFDGKLKTVNEEACLKLPGVLKIVKLENSVAVIADKYWRARKALTALEPVFEGGDTELSSQALFARYEKELPSSKVSTSGLQASYRAPFLEHAPMEPINCTAQVSSEKATVWAPTQVQDKAAVAIAEVTDLPPEGIEVNTTMLGGGFGRRLEVDDIRMATQIAQHTDQPVKMIWSREESTQHGFYRPASVYQASAEFDKEGGLKSWSSHLVTSAALKKDNLNFLVTEGVSEIPYEIPEFQFENHSVPSSVPLGYWRSVANSHTAFYVESFIDEIAHRQGVTPLDLRKSLLKSKPDYLNVLDLLLERTPSPQAGRFSGLAIHKCFGSLVAQQAEISVSEDKKVTVHRVSCAIDCGVAINPDQIAAQCESAVIFGLTAAFMGNIEIEGGRVKQSNFHDYPLLRFRQAPEIETYIVSSERDPGGVGEPPVPPIAPAIANAIFKATGERLRRLPFSEAGYRLA